MLMHYASLLVIIQILERLRNSAKEQLTPQKLNNIDSKPLALGSNEGQIRGIKQTVGVW